MDKTVKDSFERVKKDIYFLYDHFNNFNKDFRKIEKEVKTLTEIVDLFKNYNSKIILKINNLDEKLLNLTSKIDNLTQIMISTDKLKNSTDPRSLSTDNKLIRPQKDQNKSISIGNEGVQTDRQTDQQTDQQTYGIPEKVLKNTQKNTENSFENVIETLNSLDHIKKELRLQFKRLTEQELIVFSTIYQLDEERGYSDYPLLSNKLNLSESSIRDYVRRLIKKGIPIIKDKVNNKQIQLNISPDLKKIAPLSTILKLREI
jgi:hypothetical protein